MSTKEYVACPLCGSDRPRLLFEPARSGENRQGGVVRCGGCGVVYRNVRQAAEATRKHYEEVYHPQQMSLKWLTERNRLFLRYLPLLEVFRQSGRILDVGAGHGFFLKLCRDRGWQCFGTEVAPGCVDYARRELGIDLFLGELARAPFPEASFDVVTLWNVLDQLAQPAEALTQIHRLLRPGGGLVIRCLNAPFHLACRGLFGRLTTLCKAARSVDPSAFHFFSFDKHSITSLLQKHGFERVRVSNSTLCGSDRGRDCGMSHRAATVIGNTFARLLFLLSGGHWLASPSILVVAEKGKK